MTQKNLEIIPLLRELLSFTTGVAADENEGLFQRISQELPLKIFRYPSGENHLGWIVPKNWRVKRALILKDGKQVFDGKVHALGVASYSKSFQGALDLEELKPHLVTRPELPVAHVFHSMWQYRPWAADWAFCVPYEIYQTFGAGKYEVDLETEYEDGEMIVGSYEHRGRSDRTIVFNAHTCHPKQANDDMAGVALLIRLFQWLQGRDTFYSYRLILGPEHLGTVFYLRDQSRAELEKMVGGAFCEMPGTGKGMKTASSFLGNQAVDLAFHNAIVHCAKEYEFVPWRQGAGNDETVWEAPGYEVPFVEISRMPYPEYHSSLDTADIQDEGKLEEFYEVFEAFIYIIENNARPVRKFDGLVCLSNPDVDLYLERWDPAVDKKLDDDAEVWGLMQDSLLRYFDGTMTVLDIAEKHGLSFRRLLNYLKKFEEKGLIRMDFLPIERVPISNGDRS